MSKIRTRYSVHPSLQYLNNVLANMKTKTGRSVDEWVAFIKKSGPTTEVERRDWLKNEHKLGTNYSRWLAERSVGKNLDDGNADAYLCDAENWVEAMYAGKKAALKPIFERLLDFGLSIGDDVKACPCQTMVPLYRENVFAQIKPTTNTRVDLGLFLRGEKPPKRVLPTGGEQKGDRLTHRIAIESVGQIDADVKKWMKTAYKLAAPK
ncbi:hypothetical protein BH09PLA1_BH09PLA1_30460 [soil metagenome]